VTYHSPPVPRGGRTRGKAAGLTGVRWNPKEEYELRVVITERGTR